MQTRSGASMLPIERVLRTFFLILDITLEM